jgi:hypothetical protein
MVPAVVPSAFHSSRPESDVPTLKKSVPFTAVRFRGTNPPLSYSNGTGSSAIGLPQSG